MYKLRKLYDRWKKFARKIAIFQARIILTLFYFTFFMPFGIVFALFFDKLSLKEKKDSYWITPQKVDISIQDLRKQY